MKLYVISTKYQRLVNVNKKPWFWQKFVSKKSVSTHDLQTTFNASKTDKLIACDNKGDAIVVMSLLLKEHNTTPDFVESGVVTFAVPVIYTVDVEEARLSDQSKLTADDLVNYADTSSIPLYSSFIVEDNHYFSKQMQKHSKEIFIRKLAGLQLEDVTDASYMDSSLEYVVDVNLRPVVLTPLSNTSMQILGCFIAAIGIAAVATAFVALNAATFGIAGLVVAGLGVAAILGGAGLFAAGTYKQFQSTPDYESLAPVNM